LSPATEIQLIVFRELRRSVRSVKGIIIGVITLLGAVAASFLVVFAQGATLQRAEGSEALVTEARRQGFLAQFGDADLAARLASMPESLYSFLDITVWLSPLLVALLGFDLIAGELQHRSVRFWTVRARRSSYFAGKLLGLWLLVGLITFVLNAIVGCVALAKGAVTAGELLRWGPGCWLIAFVLAGAWTAVAVFISSCTRQPIVALLTTFATFFVLWAANAIGLALRVKDALSTGAIGPMRWCQYLYPNTYEHMLLSPRAATLLVGLFVPLAFVAASIGGGSLVFGRRDI
jgi:ABC-type transport system involved in multi-copper enzyme maturation permease subunit